MVVSSVLITSVFLFNNFEVSDIWQIFPMFLAKLVDFALRKKCPKKQTRPKKCSYIHASTWSYLVITNCFAYLYVPT
jgi:hypothetical protein